MKKTRTASIILSMFSVLPFALTGCATGQLHVASNVLFIADWSQTRAIAAHPQRFREQNILLGEHPSIGAVNSHFIGALLINNALYYALPTENGKRAWSLIVVGVEGERVANNARIGIRFNW